MPNAHDDIVRDDLDAIRRESFSETGLFEVVVDLVECLGLIMAKVTVSIILPSASDSCACAGTAKSNNSSDNIGFMAKKRLAQNEKAARVAW